MNKLRGADRLTILWLTRTQRASTSGTTGRGSAGRPRTPVPAACSRGVTLTSGVTGSADPNINQAFGRVGELADPVIIVRRVCGHSLYVAVEMAGQRWIP